MQLRVSLLERWQHNRDILAKLVLEDGSVLRARTNALPTLDCLLRDSQVEGGGLLQIWSLNALAGKLWLRPHIATGNG